jgi:hypothetical protein
MIGTNEDVCTTCPGTEACGGDQAGSMQHMQHSRTSDEEYVRMTKQTMLFTCQTILPS